MFISVVFVVEGVSMLLAHPPYFFMPESITAIKPTKTRKDKTIPPSSTVLNIQLPSMPAIAIPRKITRIVPIQLPNPFIVLTISSQYSNIRFPISIPNIGIPTSKNITYKKSIIFYTFDENIVLKTEIFLQLLYAK